MGIEVHSGIFDDATLDEATAVAWDCVRAALASMPHWWHSEEGFVSAYYKPPFLLELARALPGGERDLDLLQSPQILCVFPRTPAPYGRHVDRAQGATAAEGRVFHSIVGVALTDAGEREGCLRHWPDPDGSPVLVPCARGDVVVMSPETLHGAGAHNGVAPRLAVYYRILA